LTIAPALFGSAEVRWVVAQAEAELVARYGTLDGGELGLTAAEFEQPSGTFLLARVPSQHRPIGGVGLRAKGGGVGEIKRLWVPHGWRGRGIARVLMGAVETAALELGYPALQLETGDQQPEAVALYATSGWVRQHSDWAGGPIPVCSIHFAKVLAGP
jgi:GNAT superfamily N-acetyltransferase